MKRTALILPAAALAAGIVLAAQPAAPGAAGAPKAKLAQITVNAPLPKEVPFDAKPFGWDANAGYALTYVVKGTGVSEKSAPLAVAPGTTVSLGGLSFKSSKAQNFFGGGESFGIDVEGDLTKLASIEIVDGGKPLKSNGRMQMAAVTYLFPTPSSDTVTLKVSVREGNSRHTVKF